jgi:glycosyltransferase involved in cell wall biosynthesis
MTIKSVICQTYDNIEYLVIDGGSIDGTLDIIKKYDYIIDYWISEPDNGIADAFNKGIALSTGQIIGIINADDWYEPYAVQTIVDNMKSYPAVYCGHMNLCRIKGNHLVKLHKSRPDRLSQTMRVAHPSTFVTRQIYDAIGFFSTDYKIAMDYEFLLRVRENRYEIVIIDQVLSNMRLGGLSANLPLVLREELIVKNRHMGWKLQHLVWYLASLMAYIIKNWLEIIGKKTGNNA